MDLLDFDKEYVLENDVVCLRPLMTSDFMNLLPFSLYQPQLWKYSLSGAGSSEGLKNYLSSAESGRLSKKEYSFIVFDKKVNAYAGSTRYYDINFDQKTLSIGYTWYGKQFQGTGINKHCKYLLINFAFEVLQIERIEFRADNNNAHSIAAMKSIGCTVEGVLRSNCIKHDGTRRDSIVLSILKEEWNKELKTALFNKLST